MNQLLATIKDIDEHWKILTFSICIILVCGVLPSYLKSDWGWFSRSGALLVIYGIYIVWRDIKGEIHSTLDQINRVAPNKLGKKATEFSNLVEDIQKNNTKMYDTIELLILGTGTLIWAYGDLANNV